MAAEAGGPPAPARATALSAQAQEFQPGSISPYLRGGYVNEELGGWWVPYYLGSLKSFNVRTGFGFLECAQTHDIYKADVYIHKSHVPTPWKIGGVVEFAITQNSRGQPQATDCYWLPVAAQAVNEGGDEPGSAARTAGNSNAGKNRQLGVLKSYSKMQGYGFITCEEISDRHSCDVYLDRGQVPPESGWQLGQALEFEVSYNHRGQPQARNVNWSPIPKLPADPAAPAAATGAGAPSPVNLLGAHMMGSRPESQLGIRNLNKILGNLRSDKSSAVVSAIELQEGSEDINYISFVLSRLRLPQSLAELTGSAPAQLLIAVSSQLRHRSLPAEQVVQSLAWCEAIVQTLKAADGAPANVLSVARENLRSARDASAQPGAFDAALASFGGAEAGGPEPAAAAAAPALEPASGWEAPS